MAHYLRRLYATPVGPTQPPLSKSRLAGVEGAQSSGQKISDKVRGRDPPPPSSLENIASNHLMETLFEDDVAQHRHDAC